MMSQQAPSLARIVSVVVFAWSLLVLGIVYGGLGARYSLHPDAALDELPEVQLSSASSAVNDLSVYAVIGDRPLFNDTRRPIATGSDAGAEAPQPVAAPLNVVVTSIIITKDRQYAIVLDKGTNKSQTLKPGESLVGDQAGWRLAELAPRGAVFDGPGGRSEVGLRVFDGQGGEAPTPVQSGMAPSKPAENGADASGVIQESPETADPESPESRAEQIRRRIEERRRQMREEAERAKAERGE